MLSLPMKYDVARVGVLPPVAPGIGRAAVRGPLDGRRQVADDRVEPDVDPLVVALRVLGRNRDRHAPVEVARDRPRLQVLEQAEREVPDVRAPVRPAARSTPSAARRTPGRSRKRWFVSLKTGGVPSIFELRVDQVDRVELVAAVVALVAARRTRSRRSGTSPRCSGRAACGRWWPRTRPSPSARRCSRSRRRS